MTQRKRSHLRTLLLCVLGLTWGIGLTIAAVPLYRIFCQHFGIPVPQILAGPATPMAPTTTDIPVGNRTVTIRFTANTQAGLPITFHPRAYTLQVKPGQPVLTAYEAKNKGSRPIDGVAVHMLYATGGGADEDMNAYIDLRQCFCFAEEHYPAHGEVTLPLAFTVSPNLPEDVKTITFAYTLFEAEGVPQTVVK